MFMLDEKIPYPDEYPYLYIGELYRIRCHQIIKMTNCSGKRVSMIFIKSNSKKKRGNEINENSLTKGLKYYMDIYIDIIDFTLIPMSFLVWYELHAY